MTVNLKTWQITAAILLISWTPFVLVGVGLVGTVAYGCILSALIILLFSVKHILLLNVISITHILIFSLLLAYFLFQNCLLGGLESKAYLSFPVLVFYYSTAYLAGVASIYFDNHLYRSVVRNLILIVIFIAIINVVFGIRFINYTRYPSAVPFFEPSHFALFAGPILLIGFIVARNTYLRIFLMLIVVLLAFLLPTATILAYFILMTALLLRLNLFNMVAIGVLGCLFVSILINVPYFSSRLILSANSNNLSALVYIQGLQDTYYSMYDSNLLGLGFQNLGTQPPSPVAQTISLILGTRDGELNRQDGGFLAAKLISEWGALGFVIVGLIIVRSCRSFIYLRNYCVGNINNEKVGKIISESLSYTIIVELLLRGLGYFSPGLFFMIFAIALNRKLSHEVN